MNKYYHSIYFCHQIPLLFIYTQFKLGAVTTTKKTVELKGVSTERENLRAGNQ